MQSCCQGAKLINPVRVYQPGLKNMHKLPAELPADLECEENGFACACERQNGV